MRSKLLIMLIVIALLVIVPSVMAHDGNVHVTDEEMVVSGIGIILITLSVASLFIGRKDENDAPEEKPKTKNGE